MIAPILTAVLWAVLVIVVFGAVYGVVVLVARSVVPRDRWREAQSGLTRPAPGVIHGLDRKARGGTEDLPEE